MKKLLICLVVASIIPIPLMPSDRTLKRGIRKRQPKKMQQKRAYFGPTKIKTVLFDSNGQHETFYISIDKVTTFNDILSKMYMKITQNGHLWSDTSNRPFTIEELNKFVYDYSPKLIYKAKSTEKAQL